MLLFVNKTEIRWRILVGNLDFVTLLQCRIVSILCSLHWNCGRICNPCRDVNAFQQERFWSHSKLLTQGIATPKWQDYVAVFIFFVFILLMFFKKLYQYFCKVSGFSDFTVTTRAISGGGIFTRTGLLSTKEWAGDSNPSSGGSCKTSRNGRYCRR